MHHIDLRKLTMFFTFAGVNSSLINMVKEVYGPKIINLIMGNALKMGFHLKSDLGAQLDKRRFINKLQLIYDTRLNFVTV